MEIVNKLTITGPRRQYMFAYTPMKCGVAVRLLTQKQGKALKLYAPQRKSGFVRIPGFDCWNGTVEYSHAVLETIRAQAVGGLTVLSHGGLEVGGVLYGERV